MKGHLFLYKVVAKLLSEKITFNCRHKRVEGINYKNINEKNKMTNKNNGCDSEQNIFLKNQLLDW